MNTTPDVMLLLAEQMLSELPVHMRGPVESAALWRGVVSRAYYAAFWCLRAYLEDREPSLLIPENNVHYFVRQTILRLAPKLSVDDPNESLEEQIAKLIGDLSRVRKQADYEPNAVLVKRTAELAVEKSKRIIHLISEL